jgi:hypothetical protein
MMVESKRKKTENGRVIVSPDGCCTFFHKAKKQHKAGKRIVKGGISQ